MEEGDFDQTVEFRSTADDAWHPVQLDFIGHSLFVAFVEVTVGRDREVYGIDAFPTLAKLEGFRARFRPLSAPLRDTDCEEVQEGMRVCVTHDFAPDDWRLYDGVVNEVKRVDHNLADEDDEECLCNFQIYWMHGPLAGTATWTRLQKIQLIVSETRTHPILADFFDKAGERFNRGDSAAAEKGTGKRIRFKLAQARQLSDGIALSKGPESSAFSKLSAAWEKEISLCMPAIGALDERTFPSDVPALWPPIYGMQGIHGADIEFRSMKDDAWHGVAPRLMLNGQLVLVYNDYTLFGLEETYEPDKINTLGEIEDFRERFRPLSTHLIPSECGEVKEGDLVCVRMDVEETGDGKFYDSVMKEVLRYEHTVLDYEETCFCSFQIFWKHGPLGGTISTTTMDRICLITPTIKIHPALASFLDSARCELGRPKKRSRMGKQGPNLPPGFYASDDRYGVTLSRGQPSKINKEKEIVGNEQ